MAKTGPKPLTPKAFARKHAERLNYTLVKVLDDRKFEVKCNSCELLRVVTGGKNTGPKCTCTHKRKFYINKRTAKTHTKELHDRGDTEYSCLEIEDASKFTTSYNTYRHSCGNEFTMTWPCFTMCKFPCDKCRPWVKKPHDVYVAEVLKRTKRVQVVGEYLGVRKELKHKYVKCGHLIMHSPETFMALKTPGRCPVCNPSRVWRRFRVKGKLFRTRSVVEREFIKWLVFEKKVPVDAIQYEPKSSKVSYYNPVLEKGAKYTPDFKVGRTRVEVKDLPSLGLKEYHWQDKDEALIVNRAKAEAANSQFDDYRIYVYVKKTFHLVNKFWTSKEKKRLLAL